MALSVKDLTALTILGAIVLVFLYGVGIFPNPLPDVNFPQKNYQEDIDPEVEAQHVLNLIALGYNLDVFINSNHIAKHPESAQALRCIYNNGNIAAFSEKFSRRVHLICWDETTKTIFDIIIEKINYYVDKWANPNTDLVTAYSPSNVVGQTGYEKAMYYLDHLMNTVGGKAVRLRFGPQEILFIPK